ncbi:hypothetical protein KW849_14135 [Pseudomonas sp. PDM26]|uniref:hypothetical protein n=1 Tax=Pseudomonas sp. PDM26 TaxID=2854766 RepID=UPI001C438183|nr:hypothetical protein [Pseudomonas sp. PDM26]MBV7547426.1 hypothetical protein [Pseudomonas sp. PDM26]
MTEEMLASWERLNATAARISRTPAQDLSAAIEALERARIAFKIMVDAGRPKPPVEKHPEHAQDYVQAPDWVTHILEGWPAPGVFVYARADGDLYRGSPHLRTSHFSSFAVLVVDTDADDEPSWRVVSSRPALAPPRLR